MSDTTTRGVRIIVRPRFIPEQSDPDSGQWLFAYHITHVR
jgi:ApaG protein